jgi:hypothetical protein
MMRTILILAALAALLALLTSSQAHAYGAAHVGCTTAGPNGVQHTGTTVGPNGQVYQHSGSTAVGPSGGVEHTGTSTSSGPYGSAASTTTRAYSPAAYSGYSAAGGGAYGASVTRSAASYP